MIETSTVNNFNDKKFEINYKSKENEEICNSSSEDTKINKILKQIDDIYILFLSAVSNEESLEYYNYLINIKKYIDERIIDCENREKMLMLVRS